MSIQQIEAEIAKLAPAELNQLAAWFDRFIPSAITNHARPRVGEITSAPVICSEDCFAPLTDKEMIEWGFE